MKEKFNEIIHSKKIIVILIIVLIILVGAASTYAWFTWSSTNNTSLTMSIGELADVSFTTGNDISTNSLSPVFNYTDGEKTTFTIRNKSDNNLKYKVVLNITLIADELKTNSLKYKLLSGNTVVAEGDFSNITSNSSTSIYESTLSKGNINYIFYLYIDGNIENDLTLMGKSLTGNIMVEERNPALVTLTHLNSLNSTITLASGTPDFSTVSGSNGVKYVNGSQTATGLGDGTKGIYATQDDLGTSYYFRGAVDNNYVKFAGLYWRIVRINGDGTIRMIYAGTSAHANGESETDSYISKTAYNSSHNDNTYVGYMTGSTGATTYANAHSNTNNSTIKGVIDTWYKTNIEDKGYSSYVADAIYCNDRSIANDSTTNSMLTKANSSWTNTGLGYGTNVTAYGGFKRNWVDHTPSLVCPNDNDKFTTDSTLGNGKLTYPVALITSDEIAYAGGLSYDYNTRSYIANKEFYLHTPSYRYWTLTPWAFAGGDSCVDFWNTAGRPGGSDVGYSVSAARAAVSLLSDAITGGNGTMSNPFTVG